MTRRTERTFSASAKDRRKGLSGRLARAAALLPVLALMAAYPLRHVRADHSVLLLGVVAATVAITLPAGLWYTRREDTSRIDIADDNVTLTRAGKVTTVDRNSAFGTALFADNYDIVDFVVVTDGTHHFQLASGSWMPETLRDILSALGESTEVVTRKEAVEAHPEAFSYWAKNSVKIIVAAVSFSIVLSLVGGVLAILLFGAG